jgi:hypothetical protein
LKGRPGDKGCDWRLSLNKGIAGEGNVAEVLNQQSKVGRLKTKIRRANRSRFERRHPLNPLMTQISGPPIADRTDHRIVTYNFSKVDDLDEIRGAHFSWKHRFSNQPAANFKTGLRYRGEERERRQEAPQYTYVGDGIVGRNPATGINDDNVAQCAVELSSRIAVTSQT